MAVVPLLDRVRDTTNSVGTGTITLNNAPPPGYVAFPTSGEIYYCISATGNTQWEVGRSTMSGLTFTRANANVLAGSSGIQNRVNFDLGVTPGSTKDVYMMLPAAHQQYNLPTVASIAALRLLNKRTCPGDTVLVLGWNAGTFEGGGIFTVHPTDTTSADDGGLIIPDATATARVFYRQFDGIVTPHMFGAQSGATTTQHTQINKMIDAINAATTGVYTTNIITGVDLSGTWSVNGGLTSISRNDLHISGAGRARFIRLNAGQVLNFTGTGLRMRFVEVDGGGLSGSAIILNGNNPTLIGCAGYNVAWSAGAPSGQAGQGISLADGVTGHMLIACEGHETGTGGIGPGKASLGMIALCRVYNTGAEGIPGDELYRTVLLGNLGHDTQGIGFIGMDFAKDVAAVANIGWNNNSGIATGDNKGSSNSLTFMGNILCDNSKTGIWLKNKFAKVPITNITNAPAGVITYQSLSVTGVTNALPCVVTVVAHGKVDGDRVKHHNIASTGAGGTLATAINTVEFVVKVLSANTYALYDTITLEPFNSTTFDTYTAATGQMNHPFSVNDRQRIRGVVGMTQINFVDATQTPAIQVSAVTNTTTTLMNEDGSPFDTQVASGFGVYSSGGTGERGGSASEVSLIGNVVRSNSDYQIHAGWSQPIRSGNNSIITGNQGNVDGNNLEGTRDHVALNRLMDFDAALTSTKNNKTGAGTPYTVEFDQVDDISNSYTGSTGIYNVQQDGWYWFRTSVAVNNAGGTTSGKVEIQTFDRFGTLSRTFRGMLTVDLAGTEWRGSVDCSLFLPKLATVKVVLTMGGLGGDTVDLVADGTCTFAGGLLH